ncbi:hypothetical protein MLD38_027219 [Melastoma candidum]|uniref:Uncharacterized protein n=1 Tax=Melastoma candidum TaxID=119954 RepID=A0ACB9P0U0_9MYRT|nr:hypothetical protein MLD38_027219 [Melastoma candidum]
MAATALQPSPLRFRYHPRLLSPHFPRRNCCRAASSSSFSWWLSLSLHLRVPSSRWRRREQWFRCGFHLRDSGGFDESAGVAEGEDQEDERPSFDINLAVVLAGFAFEAYTSPPEKIGRREVDAAGCTTVYLSESFVREIYDGQLFIKLKKGYNFPAMDPWGTSDPYVVMELDSQFVKSKVKWGTKEPTWNEDFAFNIKLPTTKILQVAAWDANLVTPPKRMGNAGINLECLCDGEVHEIVLDLEGMGGGGKIQLEVRYKSFKEIDEGKKWWILPFVPEFLNKNGFEAALNAVVGSESVPARQFVEYAFGQLKSFNESNISGDKFLGDDNSVAQVKVGDFGASPDMSFVREDSVNSPSSQSEEVEDNCEGPLSDGAEVDNNCETEQAEGRSILSEKHFWENLSDVINLKVLQKLDLPVTEKLQQFKLPIPENLKWDGLDVLVKAGMQSQKIAEESYVESGLAAPKSQDITDDNGKVPSDVKESLSLPLSAIKSSFPDIKKVTEDVLKQTDSVLGALMLLSASDSPLNEEASSHGKKENEVRNEDSLAEDVKITGLSEASLLNQKKAEEMRALFSSAESALEAWAMLATSLGHPSFVRSEFEKLCFLDNESTDTQVAIWRDSSRRRMVIAFRGTEQARWKDLRTDLMLVPAGLNPERVGGDFKQEVQVHSGFLNAYDSVRIRIISLLKMAIGFLDEDDNTDPPFKWHVYVTGHSLGGALATLLALELSSSRLAKLGAIKVTMYNFGSPRVGNRRFADLYNMKVKDSWRVVNHRDIIPTVPRLMGYCHVAQPVYLSAGDFQEALENAMGDGYQGDVIGEYTPDVLVGEFMKGEKELLEKILQAEINIYRSIRDGSALMQHMEDFYYITLLESVQSNYRISGEAAGGQLGA